jgi:hypothetical protein
MTRSSRYHVAALAVLLASGLQAATGISSASAGSQVQTETQLEPGPVPELATVNSDTIREEDGSYSTRIYAYPVNYQDSEGDWTPIDNTLVSTVGSNYAAENSTNDFTTKIPADPSETPVAVATDEGTVHMQMKGIRDDSVAISGASAHIDDVKGADYVTYRVTSDGLKEDVVLSSVPTSEAPAYTYALDSPDGLTPVLDDVGSVDFVTADGKVAATMPPAVMYDSASPTPAQSGAVSYTLEQTGDTWTLTVQPSPAWLNDPARVYPVTIDPWILDQPDRVDCFLGSFSPDGVHCGNGTTYLKAGREDSSHKYRSLLDFDVSAIPSTAVISWANLHLNLADATVGSATDTYSVYRAGKAFNGSATWNTSGANGTWSGGSPVALSATGSKTMGGDNPGDKSFDVTAMIKGWVNGTITHTGMLFKQDSETTNTVLSFYSDSTSNALAKRPYLEVQYDQAHPNTPTGVGFTPCMDECDPSQAFTSTTSPTLHAESFDPDTSTLTYSWQIEDDDTGALLYSSTTTAPQGTVATMTVPSGVLTNHHTYDFRVNASDGTPSAWSSWQILGVDANELTDTPANENWSPCPNDDCTGGTTTSAQPTLTAVVSDPDSDLVTADLEVRAVGTTALITTGSLLVASGDTASFPITAGTLTDGQAYEFRIGAADDVTETWGPWTQVSVHRDQSAPSEPAGFALAACASPCTTWSSDTDAPTFNATNAGSSPVSMRFQIRMGTDVIQDHSTTDVAAGQTAQWAVPAGLLGPDDYEVRAGAMRDSTTTWTAWHPFGVNPSTTTVGFPSGQPADRGSDFDPNPQDPALDADDTGSQSSYTQADLDALDAQISRDTSNAVTNGFAPDLDTTTKQVGVPAKYAPLMWLDPSEPMNPLSADTFSNHSSLRWNHDDNCNDHEFANPPSQTNMGDGGYHAQVLNGFPACDEYGTDWNSNDPVGIYTNGGPGNPEGMFLDLDDGARGGLAFTHKEPVYYDYHYKDYISYWYLWGGNWYGSSLNVFIDKHEGDWEHIAIKLKHTDNSPKTVLYTYHGRGCTLSWDSTPRHNTHPEIWFAKADHASYPAGRTPETLAGGFHESVGWGAEWIANANLQSAFTRPWFGFEGSWGQVGQSEHATGPVGDSPLRDSEPNWSLHMCQR